MIQGVLLRYHYLTRDRGCINVKLRGYSRCLFDFICTTIIEIQGLLSQLLDCTGAHDTENSCTLLEVDGL